MPELVLRTRGTCQIDPEQLFRVCGEQRRRIIAALAGFGPGDWQGATRCAAWTAHEVVRHLCDITAIGITLGPDDTRLDSGAGFDPRTSPGQWLAASAGESPGATLARYAATSGELLALARGRFAQGRGFTVRMPYGPMDWTVLMLHSFWDSWIHERDVLLARGAEHPADDDATAYAIAYGAFLSATVASMFGAQVQEKLTLSGDGGGVLEVDIGDGVTVTLRRATVAGPRAAEVADTLAGRTQTDAVLAGLPAGSRAALMALASYFHTPVEQ